MYLARVQDQLTTQSSTATSLTGWRGVSAEGREATPISMKPFAHRSGCSFVLCARLAARLGNPEDRH
jgi:hypothetical protein